MAPVLQTVSECQALLPGAGDLGQGPFLVLTRQLLPPTWYPLYTLGVTMRINSLSHMSLG